MPYLHDELDDEAEPHNHRRQYAQPEFHETLYEAVAHELYVADLAAQMATSEPPPFTRAFRVIRGGKS